MPSFKRQPIGKTGVRFVIEHNFVTSSGSMYEGFSLQFPKCFGIKAEKGVCAELSFLQGITSMDMMSSTNMEFIVMLSL